MVSDACAAITDCTSFTSDTLCTYVWDVTNQKAANVCNWDGSACGDFASKSATKTDCEAASPFFSFDAQADICRVCDYQP
jgi:hypothetical protein